MCAFSSQPSKQFLEPMDINNKRKRPSDLSQMTLSDCPEGLKNSFSLFNISDDVKIPKPLQMITKNLYNYEDLQKQQMQDLYKARNWQLYYPFTYGLPIQNISELLQKDYKSPYIGSLTITERREKVQKYLDKKKLREMTQSQGQVVKYKIRKEMADNRVRENGRFVKSTAKVNFEQFNRQQLKQLQKKAGKIQLIENASSYDDEQRSSINLSQ